MQTNASKTPNGHRDTFIATLQSFAEVSLQRPDWMMLSDYLRELSLLGLLKEADATALVEVYTQDRYSGSGAAASEWESVLPHLKQARQRAEELTQEQRNAWQERLEQPAPIPTQHTNAEKETDEPVAPLPTQLQTKHPTTPKAPPPQTPPSTINSTKKREGAKAQLTTKGAIAMGLVLVFSIIVSLWLGAKHYETVIGVRYRLSNRIAKALDMPRIMVPPRYRYQESVRQRRRLERWIRWWRPRRSLFVMRRNYRRYIKKNKHIPAKKQGRMWRRLALRHVKSNRYPYAVVFFERALRFTPNDGELLNEYAWMLSQSKDPLFRDTKRALQLAKRAFKHRKKHYIADTLAIAFAQNGDMAKAVEMSRWALKHAPKNDNEEYREQLKEHLAMYAKQQKEQRTKPHPTSRPTTQRAPNQPKR